MTEARRPAHGPIPLTLDVADRKWLYAETQALDCRSSEGAAFLIRAARLSGMSLMDAGHALAAAGAEPSSDEPERENPLLREFDDVDPEPYEDEDEPAPAAPPPAAAFAGKFADKSQSDALEGYSEEVASRDVIGRDEDGSPIYAAPQPKTPQLPVAPQAFPGRNGARRDIIQLRPVQSVTAPAGFSNLGDDARGELMRRNYSHLMKGGR